MAYDEGLAERMREVLLPRAPQEKKMFGGLVFMVDGHMCVGTLGDDMMVRVGADAYDESLTLSGANPMEFTGRPLKGFVHVDAEAIAEDGPLAEWIARALDFVGTLPPK